VEKELIKHQDSRGATEYPIYTIEEANSRNIKYTTDWRNASEGDFIMTDGDPEPRVLQILYRKSNIMRHCRGSYSTSGTEISSEKRINRYTFNGLNPNKSVKGDKKGIVESDRAFAMALIPTISESKPAGDAMAAYKQLHPNVGDKSARLRGNQKRNMPQVQRAIHEQLVASGLTTELALGVIKKTLEAQPGGRPRYSDQLKASEMALKLHGVFDVKNEGGGSKVLEFSREWIEKESEIYKKESIRFEN